MFIGDTSAITKASGLPFIETVETPHISGFRLPESSERDSSRPQSAQAVWGLRTGQIGNGIPIGVESQ